MPQGSQPTDRSETIGDSQLIELVQCEGPFITVYLPTPSDVADADHRLELQWRAARRSLVEQGADETRLDSLEAHALADHATGSTRYVISADDGPTFAGALPDQLGAPVAVFSRLPALTPLLGWTQRHRPHVLATIDRTGADLLVVRGAKTESETVEGDELHVHRSKPGGWSQRRFQQRAENTWEENARLTADAIADAVAESAAELVVLAGDPREVSLVLEDLPEEMKGLARVVSGSRHDQSPMLEEAAVMEADEEARERVDLLERVRGAAAHGRAATDAAQTLEALRRHQVDTLLCVDDVNDEQRPRAVTSRNDRSMVALTAVAFGDLDLESLDSVPLVDAAVAAALTTGADVRVVPPAAPVSEGVAALLRWS